MFYQDLLLYSAETARKCGRHVQRTLTAKNAKVSQRMLSRASTYAQPYIFKLQTSSLTMPCCFTLLKLRKSEVSKDKVHKV